MAQFFSPAEQAFQPKRKFRFLVSFSNLGLETQYMVTKAAKPQFELTGPTEHRILNHTFKFPGIIKWNDVDISFIDAIEPNMGSKFYNVLRNMGYIQPTDFNNLAAGISKVQAKAAIGEVVIKQLDAGGFDVMGLGGELPTNVVPGTRYYEEWTLKNAFIKSVNFGDLQYESEDLVGIDVGLTYDFAVYNAYEGGLAL